MVQAVSLAPSDLMSFSPDPTLGLDDEMITLLKNLLGRLTETIRHKRQQLNSAINLTHQDLNTLPRNSNIFESLNDVFFNQAMKAHCRNFNRISIKLLYL